MAVRQEVHEVLDELTGLGDSNKIETFWETHHDKVVVLVTPVHRDILPPISNRSPQEHISRNHHGLFIQQAAIAGAAVPFRRP